MNEKETFITVTEMCVAETSCYSQEQFQGDLSCRKCCVPSVLAPVPVVCVLWSTPWRINWFEFI